MEAPLSSDNEDPVIDSGFREGDDGEEGPGGGARMKLSNGMWSHEVEKLPAGELGEGRDWEAGELGEQRHWEAGELGEQRDWEAGELGEPRDWEAGELGEGRDWEGREGFADEPHVAELYRPMPLNPHQHRNLNTSSRWPWLPPYTSAPYTSSASSSASSSEGEGIEFSTGAPLLPVSTGYGGTGNDFHPRSEYTGGEWKPALAVEGPVAATTVLPNPGVATNKTNRRGKTNRKTKTKMKMKTTKKKKKWIHGVVSCFLSIFWVPIIEFVVWWFELVSAFGVSLVLCIVIVYGVSQGFCESLLDLATTFFWKDVKLVSGARAQSFQAYSAIPWDLKPIYGLVIDSFPLFGYHRRSYLFMSAILGIAACVFLAAVVFSSNAVEVLIMAVLNFSIALPDVVTDAVVSQQTHVCPDKGADLQSLSWGAFAVGGLFGSGVSGPAVESIKPRGAFGLLTCAPVMLFVAAALLPDSRVPAAERNLRVDFLFSAVRKLCTTLARPMVWRSALYMFIAEAAAPTISDTLVYWSTSAQDGPKFSEKFIGISNMIGLLGLLVGITIYNRFLKRVPYRKIFLAAQILLIAAGMLDFVLVTRLNLRFSVPDDAFLLGDAAVSEAVRRLRVMPLLVLAAKLCPPGIEGTLFAFLMSTQNFGNQVSFWLGSSILRFFHVDSKYDDYRNLALVVLIRNAMRGLPILALWLVPNVSPELDLEEMEMAAEQQLSPRQFRGGGVGGVGGLECANMTVLSGKREEEEEDGTAGAVTAEEEEEEELDPGKEELLPLAPLSMPRSDDPMFLDLEKKSDERSDGRRRGGRVVFEDGMPVVSID
ncbi:hypothetical protein CBR_g18969 [Chara braunii]|uniref:Folate/biopterin transporter n=1 Tax=Chara braunii TaxID=69332 RepID=A0A388KX18_CHABU|nr:hypothetical protein CBR_g18969 [Chara braunii]|eukprot:GBG74558.1 hypothetical protein CBR_g18969 [Chara braunii]